MFLKQVYGNDNVFIIGVLCITKERKVLFTWIIEPGAVSIKISSTHICYQSIYPAIQIITNISIHLYRKI